MSRLVSSILWMAAATAATVAFAEGARPRAATPRAVFDKHQYESEQQQRRQRVHEAVTSFDAFLTRELTGTDADMWREHARWEQWGPSVLSEHEWPRDAMQAAVERFYLAKAGHEAAQVIELREALVAYFDNEAAVAAAGNDAASWFDASVQVLTDALAGEHVAYADAEPAAWWLESTGQAADLLQRVRSVYSGPVIIGQIHRGALEEHVAELARETEETRDTKYRIQDATMIGRATIKSSTQAELIAGADDVRLRVTATGTIHSPRNRSTSGRVRVYSEAMSEFSGVAELFFDGRQFVLTDPETTAETTTTVKRVTAPQMIRYAAEKRVTENQPTVEAEVEEIIKREVAEGMRAQVDETLAQFNEKATRFLTFLLRTGNDPREWTMRLTPEAVQIGYRPRLKGGLGSPQCKPPALTGDERIGLSFHDSAIEGILAAQVAGSEWRDIDFSKMQRELTGGNTEEHLIGLYPERWRVRWSWRQPVTVRFLDDAAAVTYRWDWIEIDGRRYETPLEVRMELRASATPLGHQLESLGQAMIISQDGESPVASDVEQLLVRKFSRPVGEPFHLDGLQFPAGGELDGLSGYRAHDVVLQPHWVHLKYSNLGHVRSPETEDAKHASR